MLAPRSVWLGASQGSADFWSPIVALNGCVDIGLAALPLRRGKEAMCVGRSEAIRSGCGTNKP